MKHTLIFLAAWFMSAPDAFCQTNKADEFLLRDRGWASVERHAPGSNVQAMEQARLQSLITKADVPSPARSAPAANSPALLAKMETIAPAKAAPSIAKQT